MSRNVVAVSPWLFRSPKTEREPSPTVRNWRRASERNWGAMTYFVPKRKPIPWTDRRIMIVVAGMTMMVAYRTEERNRALISSACSRNVNLENAGYSTEVMGTVNRVTRDRNFFATSQLPIAILLVNQARSIP